MNKNYLSPKSGEPSPGRTILVMSLILSFGLSSCSKDSLTPLQRDELANLRYVDVNANFCTSPPAETEHKYKYVFILDHSGSNQPGFPNPLTPNDVSSTDPNGSRRYGPMVQFLENIVPDPNDLTYFTLIDFNDEAYQPGTLSGFDASSADFLTTYVEPDWQGGGTPTAPVPYDKGFTNYQSALQMAYDIIQTDAENESLIQTGTPITVTYNIIFVSDGIPTVISAPGSPSPTYTQTFLTDISPLISSIINLQNSPTLAPFIGGITLNTAYYYQNTQIAAAETLLAQMAAAGNGQYLQFGAGQSILYQSFVPPVQKTRFNLADVWVENQNVVWWDNGQLMLDSDGDGLPDQIEMEFGSNPYAADSDSNGVNDLVEYRTKGTPCRDAQCRQAFADPYAICDGFSPQTSSTGVVTFPSTANDGLNDCEKFVLAANINTFDSNGDFVPDLLSFKTSLPFISGTNGTNLSPFNDPLNNYQKLKLGYPLSIAQNKVLDFVARSISMVHTTSNSDGTECYNYVVNNVAIIGDNNNIKVSLIQNNAAVNNKPIMTTAIHTVNGHQSPVSFSSGDFQ